MAEKTPPAKAEAPPGGAAPGGPTPGGAGPTPEEDAAFDRWLSETLGKLYADVLSEPVPDHLLDMIRADRAARGKPE